MSSLRNAVKRVTHKERSQPQNRSHLGLLEKKQDYKFRAKDYHRKQDRINAAKKRASMKNPDEFYFGMHKAEVHDGRHRKTVEAEQKEFDETIGLDTVRIMKDQDLKYVRLQRQKDTRKIERLRSSLHFIKGGDSAGSKKRKHTVFVETAEDAAEFNVADHFGTLPEMAGRAFNRPRLESLKKEALARAGLRQHDDDDINDNDDFHKPSPEELAKVSKLTKKIAKKAAKAKAAAYAEVEARTKRIEAMERAEAHLVTEKLVASKGRKRKVKAAENGKPAVYKWRRKRLG